MDVTMTDNEIIKALECCCDDSHGVTQCALCPYQNKDLDYCVADLLEQALSLINRQQAEIERLRYNLKAVLAERADHSEAIKEFAERLKSEIEAALKNNYDVRGQRMAKLGVAETDHFVEQCTGKIYALRGIDDFVDDLVKEMVGDDNG